MAKNLRGLSIKKSLVFAFVFFIMIGSFLPHSYGEEGSKVKYGFSLFGGTGDACYKNPDMTVFGFLPRVDFALHRNWDLEFEGNFSYWSISAEKNLYFLGVNGNIVFKPIQWNWGTLFVLAGGGLGYDSAGKNEVKEIGDSHCGGVYQVGAGIYYNLPKGLVFPKGSALRVEYRFYHISDPFSGDRGLYTHTALLGISF